MTPYRTPHLETERSETPPAMAKPKRCPFGTHVPVIDAINMCVACEKCGCSLRHNYDPFGELFDARRQFEREYLGGYYRYNSTVSGNGTLRQDYWYLWGDSGRDDKIWNPDRRILFACLAVVCAVIAAIACAFLRSRYGQTIR